MKIVKDYIGKIKESNEEERTITAYVSTGDKDRVGETIPPDEWKLDNYNKNPVILWSHDYRQPPVGKALWTKIDQIGLMQKIQFAKTAFAEDIFNLYKDGFLNMFSVGFRCKRDTEDESILTNCELLEVSCCDVGCNQEALAQRMLTGVLKSPEAIAMIKSIIEKEEEINKPEPEETEDKIHVRVRDPKLFTEGSFRTIVISAKEGISGVIGKLKGETATTIQKYVFDKAKGWTIPKAVEWVKEHGKGYDADINDVNKFEQFEIVPDKKNKTILDQDILKELDEAIADKENLEKALNELKSGRVLSAKNRELIQCVVKNLQELLVATEPDKGKTIDKREKNVIIIKDRTEAKVDPLAEIIGNAIKAADIPGMISKKIDHAQGKV